MVVILTETVDAAMLMAAVNCHSASLIFTRLHRITDLEAHIILLLNECDRHDQSHL